MVEPRPRRLASNCCLGHRAEKVVLILVNFINQSVWLVFCVEISNVVCIHIQNDSASSSPIGVVLDCIIITP